MNKLVSINNVKKGWGSERWFYNKNICVKELFISNGKQCSMHFHKDKEEIFYILNGEILLETINTTTGKIKNEKCVKGEYVIIPQLTPHRFTAIDGNAEILEFSTHHEDTDSYRVMSGDSQKG